MTDDDVLRGIDAPRPLPPHVRAALEAELLGVDGQVAALLRTAQAPRELSGDLRADLQRRLVRRRPVPAWLVGAAASAVLVAGAVVALPSAPPGPPTAQPVPPAASPPAAASPSTPFPAGGAPAVAEPAAPVPNAAPVPRSAPTAGADAAGADSGTGGGTTGSGPAAGAPQRGVTAVTPDEGPLRGGTRVTLSGQDLSEAVRVAFDGRPGADLVVESDTRLSVLTPAAPEPAHATVEVHLSSGEVYLIPSAFAYLAAPAVAAVDPAAGPATGGNVVVVTGRGFTSRAAVAFGDTRARDVQVLSDTELRVVAPAHLPGRVELTVLTAGGRSNGVEYVYGA